MNSFIGWIGGKKLLRKEVVGRFPEKFDRYIEVFGGAGWVLFYKDKHADLEVYNDYNSDLVNLYRCIKYHCQELQKELSFMLNSRELFEDFKAQYNIKGMTDIQRDPSLTIKYLTAIQERLSRVVIENKDYKGLIKVYDRPGALLYLDPPYYGTEKYYQAQFGTDDH